MASPEIRKPAIWNREPIAHVKRIIAVGSGKGGVGKSTTTINLAHACVSRGLRVGILDADIHGPSIPRMLGIAHAGQPEVKDGLLLPIFGHGIASMSMGHLSSDQAAIWRGPMVTKALVQMLRQVRWGTAESPLDILFIDLPPGTGDIHLTLAQQAPIDSAIIVTTPQEIATADAQKCLTMFERVNIPIAGVIENMSYFEDPQGTRHALFGAGGGEALAAKNNAPFLGKIPLQMGIREAMDVGEKPRANHAFEMVIKAIDA